MLPIFRKIIDKGFSNFLKRKAKKYNNEPIENFAMDFGESAFTPFELRFDFVDSTDRPYSAILHFNSSSVREYDLASEGDLFKIFKNKKDSTIFALKYKSLGFRSKFTFGLIGKTPSNIAQWTQTAIHAANRAVVGWTREDPEGWHLAIGGDKDHPVINYDFSYFWNVHGVFSKIKWDIKKCSVAKNGDVKISKKQILPPLQFRFQPFVGGGLGFLQNQVNTGVNFELGFFNRPYTSIPNFDYGQVYDKDVLDGKGLEFSFLLNLQTHYWITNAMLQGLLVNDNSVYVVENEDLMRVTTFWNWGVKVSFHNTTLGFLISERSKTIKFSDRKHNFGRFFLRVDL